MKKVALVLQQAYDNAWAYWVSWDLTSLLAHV